MSDEPEIETNTAKTEQLNMLICSSCNGLKHVENLKTTLGNWAKCETWADVFLSSEMPLTSFYKKIYTFDIIVILLTQDDTNTLIRSDLLKTRDSLLLEIALSFAYFGRTNTLIAIDNIKDDNSILIWKLLEATSFIYHDFSKPIDELVAKLEWHCSTNISRKNAKKQVDFNSITTLRNHYLRVELGRTRDALEYTTYNEKIKQKSISVEGELIKRFQFPTKYGDGTEQELLLISREDKIILTDQGRTLKFLDKVFELKEPDVIKNLNACLKQFNVVKDKDTPEFIIEISSWKETPEDDKNTELKEAVFRLYACISFMESMRIFYV